MHDHGGGVAFEEGMRVTMATTRRMRAKTQFEKKGSTVKRAGRRAGLSYAIAEIAPSSERATGTTKGDTQCPVPGTYLGVMPCRRHANRFLRLLRGGGGLPISFFTVSLALLAVTVVLSASFSTLLLSTERRKPPQKKIGKWDGLIFEAGDENTST